jgi:hypothetical protein
MQRSFTIGRSVEYQVGLNLGESGFEWPGVAPHIMNSRQLVVSNRKRCNAPAAAAVAALIQMAKGTSQPRTCMPALRASPIYKAAVMHLLLLLLLLLSFRW